MPKKVNYPQCSFDDALEVAKIVDSVGGRATSGVIADALKMKETGGAFKYKLIGTQKYNLVEKDGNGVKLTNLADSILHPIDDNERKKALFESFTSVEVFKELIEQLKGKDIDKQTLISMLIRMYGVNRNVASKVAWYFLKAISKYGFLKNDLPDTNKNEENNIEEVEISLDQNETQQAKKESNINIDTFDIILTLGILKSETDSGKKMQQLDKVKELIQKSKDMSHANLIIDLIENDNLKSIEKLIEAIKIDLKIA